MLLGRDSERQALERLLADARGGRSGVLALLGEPGIGKSALLDHAADRAERMRVLRARGIESEAHVPFAGLLELLRPALGALDRIPPPQAAALGSAFALRPGGAQDRFAVGAATLSLLAAFADEGPVAVLVDDVHWLDGSSAEALLFAVRRLVADPIAVALAVREDEPSLLDGADLPLLRLGGLDRKTAAELLERESIGPLPPDAVDRLYRATAGNPLALLELSSEASQLAAAPPDTPVPVSARIANSFLRRVNSLPEQARRVLVLAAAGDSGDLVTLGHAASSLGLDVADLAAAESAGLVLLRGGAVEFRHPLARSAVYGDAPPDERRAVHRALADALPDRDVDRRAWHLASAAVGSDEAASAALEQAGARARERSAYAPAAAAYERAARLAPDDSRRARLFLDAADAAWLAGHGERAAALLDEAAAQDAEPGVATRIEHLRGHVAVHRGELEHGYRVLIGAAAQAAEDDPELAVVILAEAANACFYSGDGAAMLSAAERATALAEIADGRAAFFAPLMHGMALIFDGRGDAGAESLREAIAVYEASDELRRDPRLLAWAAAAPLWLRESETGRALAEHAIEAARERTALGVLPYLLWYVARDEATTDRWAAAHVDYHESIRLARETGQVTELSPALAGLAWLDARQGKEAECRAHAQEAREVSARFGLDFHAVWTFAALGDLELGLGRPAAAVEHFLELEAALGSLGIADVDVSPAPELVDAYLRLGRADDAAAAARAYAERARRKGQPWALARAERCLGLTAPDDEFEARFAEALRFHDGEPDVFERGRTLLAYGARLRRARQRVRAREQLRAALAIFEKLGASPWAELASAELAATGETARRRDATTLDELTPQELQIALLLADGKTTREAAAALSPKTIEYHLRNVYRKLEIRSREELATALASSR